MLEFIRLARKRGAIADILHILFNLLFVAATVALVMIFPDTPWPAMTLLFISKWRTIAVRPRYWWMNTVSSLPDLAFGAAMVTLMWSVGQEAAISANGEMAWVIQVIFGLIYSAWLIWLKPRSDKKSVIWQAGISQFFMFTALFTVNNLIPLVVVMMITFVVSFGAARRIFTQYVESSRTLLSMIYGFIVAAISFAAWHWTVSYGVGALVEIPQVAIIVSALGFSVTVLYDAHETKSIKWHTVGWPLTASGLIVFLVTIIGGALFV